MTHHLVSPSLVCDFKSSDVPSYGSCTHVSRCISRSTVTMRRAVIHLVENNAQRRDWIPRKEAGTLATNIVAYILYANLPEKFAFWTTLGWIQSIGHGVRYSVLHSFPPRQSTSICYFRNAGYSSDGCRRLRPACRAVQDRDLDSPSLLIFEFS